MRMKRMAPRVALAALLAAVLAAGVGCRKSSSEEKDANKAQTGAPQAAAGLMETVARVHWLGKKRIAADPKSAYFMTIWKLPESARLEAQTLDKLATAPWRLGVGGVPATNVDGASRLLRPLLEDVLQDECYFEVRQSGKSPGDAVAAVRLDAQRASVWETNLAGVMQSLTGGKPQKAQDGWSLKNGGWPTRIELRRVGEWSVVGLGQENNLLLEEIVARIGREHVPFVGRGTTNYWLETSIDPQRFGGALSLNWHCDALSMISLMAVGEGENVHTRGDVTFSMPPGINLESWKIPTDLISDPLISFSAMRGIKPFLSSVEVLKRLQISLPNQLFLWSFDATPLHTFFAAPLADANRSVEKFSEYLIRDINTRLHTNDVGNFEPLQGGHGVMLSRNPFASPFLESVVSSNGQYVVGGLLRGIPTNKPMPGELLNEVVGRTNLVCYDWELTEPRIKTWFYLGQLLRMQFGKAQMPEKSAGVEWLVAAASKLGNCATIVTKTGPFQLSFSRKSSAGFSAIELHLLMDWLESPEFPRGLHTTIAAPPPPRRRPGTNSVPAGTEGK